MPNSKLLSTIEDIGKFDEMLDAYIKSYATVSPNFVSLKEASVSLENWPEKNKIFSILTDIKINMVLLYIDIIEMSGRNNNFIKRKLKGGLIFDYGSEVFIEKMNIHRAISSFIFRYRAIWDKLMGFIILYYNPEDFKGYDSAKSKKAAFRKIMEKSQNAPPGYSENILKNLDYFDNHFRTGEAHGPGSIRQFSFDIDTPSEHSTLLAYWNMLNKYIQTLNKVMNHNAKIVKK